MALDGATTITDADRVHLGEEIRRLLDGKPAKELAAAIGVDAGQVSRLISGQVKELAVDRLVKIEQALNVRPGHLFRCLGVISDDVSVRDALSSDPSLNPRWRSDILHIYDAWVLLSAQEREAEGTKTAGTKRAPMPVRRPRK